MLCFSKQNRNGCYKSRSPTPEYWWQFTFTKKSNFEHNSTGIALSSFNKSGINCFTKTNLHFFVVVGQNYLFALGSLDHAKTELLDFSTWNWRTSLPYFSYTEIYSFAAFFYQKKFYVVGGKTINEVLSGVSTFNPITEKWSQIGSLKFPRFDHTIDIISDKLYIIGGSEEFEYCDLLNGFECSVLTNARFKQNDFPKLYGLYPSKCEPGILIVVKRYKTCKI